MKTKEKTKKDILNQVVKMDAEVIYFANGDVNVVPSPWENERRVTGGDCVKRRGRMSVEPNGESHFSAYRENSGSRYEVLMETANGELKRSRLSSMRWRRQPVLVAKFSVPLNLGNARIVEALESQMKEMVGWLKMNG